MKEQRSQVNKYSDQLKVQLGEMIQVFLCLCDCVHINGQV